jgi:uncharacterized protein (DUF2461 family)
MRSPRRFNQQFLSNIVVALRRQVFCPCTQIEEGIMSSPLLVEEIGEFAKCYK